VIWTIYCAASLLSFGLLLRTGRAQRIWMVGFIAVFLCCSVLMVAMPILR